MYAIAMRLAEVGGIGVIGAPMALAVVGGVVSALLNAKRAKRAKRGK